MALAWILLILALAGDAAWQALGAGEPPKREPPEPFFVALEPPEPPPAAPSPQGAATPPADGSTADGAMPAMPDATDVPQVTAQPPQEPGPGQTPMARPAPQPPRTRVQAGTATPPATSDNPQTAAVAPAPPAAPGGPPGGVATWQKYATPFDWNDPRPRIAIVILDLGLSSAATEAAVQNLPPGVTLAFSPYAENLGNWLNLARASGHEALLGLPMEPANFPARDPGPRTLLTSLSPRENLDRLDWVLSRVSGYVGVTNNMGSRFTASAEALRPVLTTLRDRGLVFVDSRTTPRSVAASLATSLGLPRAINDRLIDQQAARAAIDAMLADVEKVARETGNAVAMGQPYPVTFERLAAWLPTLEGKGIALAPITALLNRQPDS
ncbi:MAG TPA: divergent polysaccharide deacetylase family protein [Alphaproteobacteria bacterium]